MVETDSPWCSVTSTHASFAYLAGEEKFEAKKKERFEHGKQVKGRNEPRNIIQILHIIAQLKKMEVKEVASVILDNTKRVFFPES